jgi:hypothetical protein
MAICDDYGCCQSNINYEATTTRWVTFYYEAIRDQSSQTPLTTYGDQAGSESTSLPLFRHTASRTAAYAAHQVRAVA